MNLFGTTRSHVRRTHALIAPDSHVGSDVPGWERSRGIILISPRMGARFAQYLALMEPGGTAGPAPPDVERVLYVLEGQVALTLPGADERTLETGGFAYCPPGAAVTLRAVAASRLNLFEKRYLGRPGLVAPGPFCGHEQEIDGTPFLGDPDAILKVLLPVDPRFDLAVNVFTYQPGATLPLVEVHVMEHGLLMLEGQGVYRLGDEWYPVTQGDAIWMAPFCPQWFVAMGKSTARYLYYKDVNRDSIEEAP
ncbi:MAG: (S)-ureidoglycine aminohydrolase [Isosphaerales bacterium]